MKVRPVEPKDIPAIIRLTSMNGFASRSHAGWHWVLFENPEQADSPSGYVVETDGKVAAFLGGAGHRLHGTGTDGFVVAAHTFVSDLSSPGHGPRLIRHGFKHTRFDATYTLHNNAYSSIFYKRFGLAAIWKASGRQYLKKRLRWGSVLASAALRRLARNAHVQKALLRREWFVTRPKGGSIPLAQSVRQLDPFEAKDASAIDALDSQLEKSGKIVGARTAEVWRYRLKDPDRVVPTHLFSIDDDQGIAAMLATSISKDDKLSVVTLDIEDLVFRPGSEHHLATLLAQAKKCARHAKAARIMLRVLPPNLDIATADSLGFKARPRAYDSCHFGGDTSWDPLSWEVSPFDGDFWFALRRPPAR